MGKYLELAAQAKSKTTYDQNDINDISGKAGAYQRPKAALPYDQSQGQSDAVDLPASLVVTSLAANPLKSSLNRFCRFGRILSELERRCPELIVPDRWRLAIEDARRFIAAWGEQAEAFGWTERDLFGLHEVPANPHPTYQRLSRYDCTGLIWMLQGCPVVALMDATAAIKMPSGSVLIYRKHNKPAYGPLGDGIDDFVA